VLFIKVTSDAFKDSSGEVLASTYFTKFLYQSLMVNGYNVADFLVNDLKNRHHTNNKSHETHRLFLFSALLC